MHRFAPAAFALVLACAATLASAQVRMAPVQPIQQARPAGIGANPAQLVDRQALLERRLTSLGKKNRALEGRVATLEAALREMRAASEFTCSTSSTSTNGRGSENCAPFACNYLDGRCRTTAATSDHCAPGFLMDGGRCVAPPPPAPDDECFLFFC